MHLDRPGVRAFLGDLEADVMLVVWHDDKAALTVREIWNRIAAERPLAYTTVLTTVQRLTAKGLLHNDRTGITHRYRAMVSLQVFIWDAYGAVLDHVTRTLDSGEGGLVTAGVAARIRDVAARCPGIAAEE